MAPEAAAVTKGTPQVASVVAVAVSKVLISPVGGSMREISSNHLHSKLQWSENMRVSRHPDKKTGDGCIRTGSGKSRP